MGAVRVPCLCSPQVSLPARPPAPVKMLRTSEESSPRQRWAFFVGIPPISFTSNFPPTNAGTYRRRPGLEARDEYDQPDSTSTRRVVFGSTINHIELMNILDYIPSRLSPLIRRLRRAVARNGDACSDRSPDRKTTGSLHESLRWSFHATPTPRRSAMMSDEIQGVLVNAERSTIVRLAVDLMVQPPTSQVSPCSAQGSRLSRWTGSGRSSP